MSLDLNEIKDGDHFEELVAAYFKELKNGENNILDAKVMQSGIGADGGRDILVTYTIADGIKSFKRTWVIQCKFHKKNISPSAIKGVNIPSLVHSYEAAGYLLVCKKRPTSGLTGLFDKLNSKCKFKYKYEIWDGEQFKRLLLGDEQAKTIKQFFPEYCKSQNNN